MTSSDYLWQLQNGLGCELGINGYKKKNCLMNSSHLHAVNLSYMCIRDAFYRDTCSYSRRLFLLYLFYTICKHSENICMKVMANLLTVSLEWVWISKRLYVYIRHFYMCHSTEAPDFLGTSKEVPKYCVPEFFQV